MLYEEKTMKSEKLYEGKILTLRVDTVELPNRKYSKREIVEHSGAVAIVPVTDKNEIVMVKQYRKAIEDYLLEIPAGMLEYNEEPLDCAKRELKEETGYEAKNMELLCEIYTSPGFSTEKVYIFLARDLKEGEPDLDEGEHLEVERIEIKKLIDMILKNEIKDSKSINGILMAQNKLE